MAKTDQHASRTCQWLWQTGSESHAMADQQTGMFKVPSADDPKVTEVVRRLVEVYRPERIYLFGSTARGDAGPDSDYDLLVIVSDRTPPSLQRAKPAYQAIRGTGCAADVQVWGHSAFKRQLHLRASLPSTVVREGKLLYEA